MTSYVDMPLCCCSPKISINAAFNLVIVVDVLTILVEGLAVFMLLNYASHTLGTKLLILGYVFLAVPVAHFLFIVYLCSLGKSSRDFNIASKQFLLLR